MITSHRVLAAAAAAGTAVLLLSGCVAKSDAQATAAFDVSSTATDCAVSASTAKSGTLTFDVKNDTDQVSEFYLLAEDGLRIVGEVENIAPVASRTSRWSPSRASTSRSASRAWSATVSAGPRSR